MRLILYRLLYGFLIFLSAISVLLAELLDDINLLFIGTVIISISISFYVYFCKGGFKNHWLYFYTLFFIFFIIGPLLSLLLYGNIYQPFLIRTTFANGVSIAAINATISYMYYFLLIQALLIPLSKSPRMVLKPNPELTRFSFRILSLLLVLLITYKLINFEFVGYTQIYVAKGDMIESLLSSFTYAGFLLFLASVARKSEFKIIVLLYIAVLLFDVVLGYRGGILIFMLTSLWYYSIAYRFSPSKLQIYTLVLFIVVFLFVIEAVRSDQLAGISLFVPFVLGSLSKGIYTTSLYLDHSMMIDERFSYTIFGPLSFTYQYLFYGSEIVGNNPMSADIRQDLNHVMSSTINYSAYLNGAGLGSSFLPELIQLGKGLFLLFALLFFFLYEYLLRYAFRYRVLLPFAVFTFQHFIFISRDSYFPFFWGYIKLSILLLIIYCVYWGYRKIKI
ncbi:O-antigen polysaccharide polymerase Wzy family protein [Gammaproteobacteria bacterium]|nr:O-antigen polysaccharide polymerase Wzy family protein [Gammaproteobacteria bacterium]